MHKENPSMSSHWLRSLLGAFVLGMAVTALAQVPRNPPPYRSASRLGSANDAAESPAPSSPKFLSIPGLVPLSMEGVLRDIGLTPEQKRQLKAVSEGYAASMQQLGKSFREFSPEEQRERAKDIHDQVAQFARNARRKAEAILTPQQLHAVEKIAFQLSAAAALSDPGLQKKLGLNSEQRQRLNGVYEQAGEKMQQLQRDTAAQVMRLLNEEQTAELKKQIDVQPKTR
jgi:Spy/CpxP family protein refolding chaperone